jgi:hypothetical protein
MTEPLTTESLAVPGVEVKDGPDGAKAFMGPFYADQLELLRDSAKQLKVRENHFVARSGPHFWIYRRP